jgi:hypothetical protein
MMVRSSEVPVVPLVFLPAKYVVLPTACVALGSWSEYRSKGWNHLGISSFQKLVILQNLRSWSA